MVVPLQRLHMLGAQGRAEVAISAITHGEILFGIERKPGATRLRAAVEHFLGTVQILPWDASIAPVYGMLRASLETTGKTLSGLDLLIAAHALALRATLVTHDPAFKNTSHLLQIVDWATDL